MGRIGRMSLPWALFAYPFYLWKRSPGKEGSHYDPDCDLFTPQERNLVRHTVGVDPTPSAPTLGPARPHWARRVQRLRASAHTGAGPHTPAAS